MQNSHAIANDNSPLSQHPLGDSIGFNAALREKNNQRTAIDDHFGEDWTEDPSDKAQTGFNIYRFFLLLWAAAIVSVMWFQFMDRALGGQIATFILLICSSLALHPAAKMVRRFRLSEFAIFTALAATLGLWLALSELYFFEISAADAAVGFSGIALIIAWLMKSDIALIISCCAALIWVTLHQSIGTANLIPMSILPLLIGMQLITASQHSSTIAIATACFAAYLWIYMMCFTHYAQNNISMLHVAGLVTLIGAAHHRIGKMLDDSKVGGAPLHAVLSWQVPLPCKIFGSRPQMTFGKT